MKRSSLVLALVGMTGCGTILDTGGWNDDVFDFDSPSPHVFGGLRTDVHRMDPDWLGPHLAPAIVLFILDFPLSMALDLVLFPITAPLSLVKEGRRYETVDRPEFDQAIAKELLSNNRVELWYMGSEEGYHHVRMAIRRPSDTSSSWQPAIPFRIKDGDLPIDHALPYTRTEAEWKLLKRYHDPWPLPTPLVERER